MQILWASHIIPYPPKSGVHSRSYHLLRSVAAQSEVDLLAFIQEPWLRIFYNSREEALADCAEHLGRFCRSVRFIKIDNLNRRFGKVRTALEGVTSDRCFTKRWLDSPAARQAFMDAKGGSRYELAHFDTLSLAPFRTIFPDIPATLGHHNVESHMLLRRSEKETGFFKRWYFRHEGQRVRSYEAEVARWFATHITCSELDSERLREVAGPINAVAIPNGVDIDFFRPSGRAPTTQSLVFVGSLNWYPNVDAVLFLLREIWPLLKLRMPGVQLDIIGSSPPHSIVEIAASLRDVRVHGFVDDVRPFIDAASVYVCPIRDGGGTKLKMLDAFAMGKCVIAHPIACEGIGVTPGLNVLTADSAISFAEGIQALLLDHGLRENMGNAARELVVAQYSFAQIGQRLSETFLASTHLNPVPIPCSSGS